VSIKLLGTLVSDEFLSSLEDYSVVIPSRVTQEGRHVTFLLHPGHSLRRRSALQNNVQSTDDILHYSVHINDKQHILQLQLNERLVSPGFVIERRKNRFKNVTDSSFSRLAEEHKYCHYTGQVTNHTDSRVAVATCAGLVSKFAGFNVEKGSTAKYIQLFRVALNDPF